MDYYFARQLIEINAERLTERQQIYRAGPGDLYHRSLPYITPVSLFDPRTRLLLNPWVGSNLRTVVTWDTAESYPGVAENCQIVVPAGEEWEVDTIILMLDTDGNAANRNLTLGATSTLNILRWELFETTAIVIAANQVGVLYMTAGQAPALFTNTNGVFAVVADENPLPLRLRATDQIDGVYDNQQVGDLAEMLVFYKLVGPV